MPRPRVQERRNGGGDRDGNELLRVRRVPDRDEDALASFERQLLIDEHNLESACTQHSDLLYRVAKEVAYMRSRRDKLKKELKEAEASAYIHIRQDLEGDDRRITEAEVQARVTLDRECKRFNEQILDANETLGQWEALKEAVHQRSYALSELVELWLARNYGGNPAASAEYRMRDRTREVATERLYEARREQRESRDTSRRDRQ
jgi:hypothetical protein